MQKKGIFVGLIKYSIDDGLYDSYELWEKTVGKQWCISRSLYSSIMASKTIITSSYEGCISGFVAFDIVNGKASIVLLIVDPEFRRQGIGSGLLDQAFRHIKLQGASSVTLCLSEEKSLWRALPDSMSEEKKFFLANGWTFNEKSLDQFGCIENYQTPKFLGAKLKRQNLKNSIIHKDQVDQLLDFQLKNFPHWHGYYKSFIDRGQLRNIVVATVDNKIIGSCLVEYPGEDFSGSNWIKILGEHCASPSILGVEYSYRGHEVGYYLFDFAIRVLSKAGAKFAFINQSDAAPIYKRFGFETIWQYEHGHYDLDFF